MLWPPRWPGTLGNGPPGQRGAAGAAGRNRDTVGQLRQLNELAAVERQCLDLAVVDDFRHLGVRRAQERRLGRHRDGFGQLSDFEHHRQSTFCPTFNVSPCCSKRLKPESSTNIW